MRSPNSQIHKEHKGCWSNEEHHQFLQAVKQIGLGKWKQVASLIDTRNAQQCQIHYYKLKNRMKMTDKEFYQFCMQQLKQEQESRQKIVAEYINQQAQQRSESRLIREQDSDHEPFLTDHYNSCWDGFLESDSLWGCSFGLEFDPIIFSL